MGKGIYSIVANDESVGTTVGSFDAIDTRNGDIRLTEGTSRVVALSVVATPAAQTTATGMGGRLRFTSSDVGNVGNEDFATGQTHGGGVGSNSMSWGIPVQWIPVEWEAHGGDVVNMSWSSIGIEPADSFAVQVAVHHLAGPDPPADWFMASMSGGIMPLQGSRSSNGGNTTTARVSLTATTIPGTFSQIVSVMPMTIQDPAVATTDFDSSFMEMTSTIGDWDPQEVPMPGIGAGLGTIVGGGPDIFQRALPMYLPKANQNETIEPFVTGLDTLGAANSYGYSMGLRF